MARTKHRFTAKAVENQRQPGLYADGGNLHLRIASGGTVQPPQSGPLIWGFSNIVSGTGGRIPSA